MLIEKGAGKDFIIRKGVVYKTENGRDLMVVPEEMITDLVRRVHNKGHFNSVKTEEVLKQDFFIPNMRKFVEKVVANCVQCILCNKKRGKGEGFLNPIPKENVPLSTYHLDHVGPFPSTNKNYQHILTVVDAFTKFCWFYPVKTTAAKEVIDKLKAQQNIFGHPERIITDRGPAFTSKDFEDYCVSEDIEHVKITTGIPRGNGQVERIHSILLPVLSKLAIDDPSKWFKFVPDVQRIINSTTSRSTKYTPFELLTGKKMKDKDSLRIKEILNEEYLRYVMEERDEMREEARKNIIRLQEENRRQFNRRRKKPNVYKVKYLVAIQRTQYGTGLKLRQRFHGPYRVTAVKTNDRYCVEKVGSHEGPIRTTTAADHMKPWSRDLHF